MKLLTFNVNDFGGQLAQREAFRRRYGSFRYLREWDSLDKSIPLSGCLDALLAHRADAAALQELDVNAPEGRRFIREMARAGYRLICEPPSPRASMTVLFLREELPARTLPSPHAQRSLRACAVELGGLILYAVHVPPRFDGDFWAELLAFYTAYREQPVLLLGDFNTINLQNERLYHQLLALGGQDVWQTRGDGGAGDTTLGAGRLDRGAASPALLPRVRRAAVDAIPLERGFSDHAIVSVELT